MNTLYTSEQKKNTKAKLCSQCARTVMMMMSPCGAVVNMCAYSNDPVRIQLRSDSLLQSENSSKARKY